MKRMIDNKEYDALKSKVDDLENVATKVEANPELEGTEASLTGLQVGDTKYVVSEGTVVNANPELVGGESSLTSIQIGDTKYKVIEKEYQHNIRIVVKDNQSAMPQIDVSFTITNKSNTKINTYTSLRDYLDSKGFKNYDNTAITNQQTKAVSGFWNDTTNTRYIPLTNISTLYSSSTGNFQSIRLGAIKSSFAQTINSGGSASYDFIDNVIEI